MTKTTIKYSIIGIVTLAGLLFLTMLLLFLLAWSKVAGLSVLGLMLVGFVIYVGYDEARDKCCYDELSKWNYLDDGEED
jgi:uncharacterized membrane protein